MAELAGYDKPTRHIPLGLAKALAIGMEGVWKLFNMTEAPLLSTARIKLLGLNLDFSIDKARKVLGYDPQVDFREAIEKTMRWFNQRK
ncbi:MAG: hypothetical protein R3B90_12850 [Planctomycetaceae bacterium]